MRRGSLSSSIYNRSVIKNIKRNKDIKFALGQERYQSPAVIGDIITATATGLYPIEKVVNEIASLRGSLKAISLTILINDNYEEKDLKKIVKSLDEEIREHGGNLSGIVVNKVEQKENIIIIASAVATLSNNQALSSKDVDLNNYSLLMLGSVAEGGIRKVIEIKKDIILKKYNDKLIKKALPTNNLYIDNLCKELLLEGSNNYIIPLGEGGFFSGLWQMSEALNKGFVIEAEKIPIRQEIIEICELLALNPYQLDATGAALILTKEPEEIFKILKAKGYLVSEIGFIDKSRNKLIRNRGLDRFLDRPEEDEIYKII